MEAKIQKILSTAGYGSRRTIESLIKQGEIRVNNQLAHIGQRINPDQDHIRIRNKNIPLEELNISLIPQVIIYNKPIGVICSRNDELNRQTVFDNMPPLKKGRWINIGRLDINSSGLLLLTNYGELAYRLMHPKYRILREYSVRVLGDVQQHHLDKLRQGMPLEDGMASFAAVKPLKDISDAMNQWFTVTLYEGKNREVRRLWESVGFRVNRLVRTRYGIIKLPKNLSPNATQILEPKPLHKLIYTVGLT